MERYAKNSSAVHSLKYHIVFCPKYRRDVLRDGVDARFKQIVDQLCVEHGWSICGIEVMPDHVHLFIEADPRFSVVEIVNRIKGRTSRILRGEFPQLRSRIPTLWTRSYYAGTVGFVSESAVKRYIENQKGK